MDGIRQIRALWQHGVRADETMFAAMGSGDGLDHAWREYAHILAAQEVWLARLEGRPPTVGVWPVLSSGEAAALRQRLATGYASYLEGLTPESLSARISYLNSAGDRFENTVTDILLHVLMHGQYHRGKVNLLLRQQGRAPWPVDYIAFVRGAPAAVTPLDAGETPTGG